jgi:pimeloyl-ACP methyl ester carboxylesterase
VLASADRMAPAAFAALRRSTSEVSAKDALARFRGPAVAIEAAGEPMPVAASRVLGLPRTTIANVSHWLMMDDPAATNAALDAFLSGLRRP